MTPEQAKLLFDYDPASGVMRWKVPSGRYGRFPAGCIAGSPNSTGCLQISYRSKKYKVHRVAFAIMTGRWPAQFIDHIDGNPANNAWSNIREASPAQNKRNQRIRKDSRTGVKGVWIDRRVGKFAAQITVDGQQISLGYYRSLDDAAKAYREASQRYHGEFGRVV